jgi:nitrogen regulatory protein PII
MKKIECLIWPEKSSEIVGALRNADVIRVALVPVEAFGTPESRQMAPVAGVRLEILAHDDRVEEILDLVSTRHPGGFLSDGAVVVSPVDAIVEAGRKVRV